LKKKNNLKILEEGYTSYRVPIESVKINPMNPRTIEDSRFELLVSSIKQEPHILKLRPIVVNKDMLALGGNQRLKACQSAGLDSVWIINADDINDEEQRSFIIADNVDFGKWDTEILKSCGYEIIELKRLGVEEIELTTREAEEIKERPLGSEDITESEREVNESDKKNETFDNTTMKQIILYYPNDLHEKVCYSLDLISKDLDCDDNSEVVLRLINFWVYNNEKNVPNFDSEQ